MHSKLGGLLALGFFLCFASAGCRREKQAEPDHRTVLEKLTKRDRLFDIAMVGDHAWIVGFPGIILHSGDGGANWEVQDSGSKQALFSVDFVNEKRGWIVGRYGLVLSTGDSGATWTPMKGAGKEHLFDVDFVDENLGWAVGNFGTIMHTADGGQSWSTQAVSAGEEEAADDEDYGDDEEEYGEEDDYGDDGEDEEDDYGEAEAVAPPPPGEGDQAPEAPRFDRLLNGVAFVDALTGWIAGEDGTILHTSDGGKVWRAQVSNEWAPLYAVLFLNRQDGYVAGTAGSLLATSDGGSTWEKVETNTDEHLFKLAVSDDQLLGVGRRGLVMAGPLASRGPFERLELKVYGWLDSVAINDKSTGFMVGAQGLVMKTEDGGKNWKRVSR